MYARYQLMSIDRKQVKTLLYEQNVTPFDAWIAPTLSGLWAGKAV